VLIVANLSDADLSGADLKNAQLQAADLSGANLSGTNLTGTNLEDAEVTEPHYCKRNLSKGPPCPTDRRTLNGKPWPGGRGNPHTTGGTQRHKDEKGPCRSGA